VSRAEADADEIRDRALAAAREIVAAAKTQADAIRADARDEGRAEGLAGCLELATSFRAEQGRLLADQEAPLLRLAVRIAERIIDAELRSDPETLRGIVREAVRPLIAAPEIRVRVHPQDVEAIEAAREAIATEVGAREVEVHPDERLSPGSCRVETSLGTVDADLRDQLRAIEIALLGGGTR
jgi:flagellar assembly protein FliH